MKDSNILQSEVRKTFETLIESGVFTEVRILNTKQGILSGYYNDVDKLIEHIQRYDRQYNIYITMNALSEGIEARGKNHLKNYAKNTTSDKEIRCRRWILIDLDPERPAGISSTEQVKVDTTTYNAARITKLYGTVSCKGDSTEERPHRRSKILYAPKKRVPVAIELLQQIAAQCVEKGNKKKTVNRNEKREPAEAYQGARWSLICVYGWNPMRFPSQGKSR